MRTYWTFHHTAVCSFTLCLAFIWVTFVVPRLIKWTEMGWRPYSFFVLSAIGVAFILYLSYRHLIAYDLWRRQVIADDTVKGNGHFKDMFWSIAIIGDEIEVRYFRRSEKGTLSSVQRVEASTCSGRVFVTLCYHTSKWQRRDKEISINLTGFPISKSLPLLRMIRDKTPQAEMTREFLAMAEEGKGLT